MMLPYLRFLAFLNIVRKNSIIQKSRVKIYKTKTKTKIAGHLAKNDVAGVTAGHLMKMRDCHARCGTVGRSDMG